MWHTALIVLHATAATVALLTGLVTLPSGRLFGVHRWSVIAAVAALAPAVALGWPAHDTATRVAHVALLGLAGVMVLRTEQARRLRPTRTGGPTVARVDAVGFTLISLADGFAVVAAVRGGAPGWAVALVGVGVAVAGHLALQAAKGRIVRGSPAPTAVAGRPLTGAGPRVGRRGPRRG